MPRSSKQNTTIPWPVIVGIQILFVGGFGLACLSGSKADQIRMRSNFSNTAFTPQVKVVRNEPLRITPLYNAPDVVSDDDLVAVLERIRPRFSFAQLSPNFVEHALRVWSIDASFQDSKMMSGEAMRDFLLDHAQFVTFWGDKTPPLLVDRPKGIAINWGRDAGMSVHHDHTLACLTEAGVTLDTPVFAPSQRQLTVRDILMESLRDFRLDERETEWTAMAFGLWLAPEKEWYTAEGRKLSFDLLAKRLLRGELDKGVCSGTHRVYSLAVLMRLDGEFGILSERTRNEIEQHLKHVRDLICESQFEDGHWPSNWHEGSRAVTSPKNDELKSKVIATGHHLEWLAIMPEEYHPPRERIRKAAKWCIENTVNKSDDEILDFYTFFSHVGNALALWRSERPSDFWREHGFSFESRRHPKTPEQTTAQ